MISLRNRLLASYLFLLVFTLGGIVIALIVTTGSQPAPPQKTYQFLVAHIRNVAPDRFITLPSQENPRNTLRNVLPPNSAPVSVVTDTNAIYTDYASTYDVRIMQLSLAQIQLNAKSRYTTVNYDSASRLTFRDVVHLQMDDYERIAPELTIGTNPSSQIVFGRFESDGQEWLFTGIQPNLDRLPSDASQSQEMLIVAKQHLTLTLQDILIDFGTSLVRPLLQASLIGFLIAILLSILISRTIAYPLQAAEDAATAVAHGNLDHKIPLTGPKEVRTVAHAFNRMSAEVKATQQAQHDFVTNVSHDLKTPLTSIQGYAQAIMDSAAKDPKQAAEIIYDEAARMNRMVAELTDLARLEDGQLSMQHDSIDVGEIATRVAHKLSVVAKSKDIDMEMKTAPMPAILGDGDRIVQVLTNLLSNAIKYTQTGGQVAIQTQVAREGVEVHIADTGVGIPEYDLKRIFERFYQVDKARSPSRGTGLGLAIAREIVQLHGGTIHVKSKLGQGATFIVWLPLEKQKHTDEI